MALPGSAASSSASMGSRELLLHRARIASVAGRFGDSIKAMHDISELCVALTQEEHNLLVSSYTQYMYPRHASLAALVSIEMEETNGAFLEETRSFRKTVQSELENFYTTAIDQLSKNLIPYSVEAENVVFYQKLEGDFYWGLGELLPESERILSFDNSLKAYEIYSPVLQNLATQNAYVVGEIAEEQAVMKLPPANRARLLVAYKHSMFYSYMQDSQRSSKIAKVALVLALGTDAISQDLCDDSKVLLELLKEMLFISSVDFAIKSGVNELVSELKAVPLSKQSSDAVRCFSTPYEQGPPAPVRRIAVPPADEDTFVSPPSYMPTASARDIRARRKASSCRRGLMG